RSRRVNPLVFAYSESPAASRATCSSLKAHQAGNLARSHGEEDVEPRVNVHAASPPVRVPVAGDEHAPPVVAKLDWLTALVDRFGDQPAPDRLLSTHGLAAAQPHEFDVFVPEFEHPLEVTVVICVKACLEVLNIGLRHRPRSISLWDAGCERHSSQE